MKDMREVVLYFGDGCKLVPIDIAKSLSDRFEELGKPLVLTPEASQKTAPLVVFKDNPDFMATVTQMTINLVVNHTYFEKLETIIFDVVDAFDDLNILQIFASYRIENNQSKRVLEKLGFKYYSQLNNISYSGEVFREIAMLCEK